MHVVTDYRSIHQIRAEFRSNEDTLFVSFGPPTSCYELVQDEGITFRCAHVGNHAHSVVITEFLGRWRRRRQEAYERIASFLRRPLVDICSAVEPLLTSDIQLLFGSYSQMKPSARAFYSIDGIDEKIAYLRERAADCRKLAQRARVKMHRVKWEEVARDLEKRADELEKN